jgi:hypothetical protein
VPTNQALARNGAPDRIGLRSYAEVSKLTGYDLSQIAMIRHNMAGSMGCTPEAVPLYDIALFCHSAQVLGLDPLLRQCYWIPRNGRGTLQVGIDGYRAIADRTRVYGGSDEPTFRGVIQHTFYLKGKEYKKFVPETATCVVWKIVAGHRCAFRATVRWDEFCPNGDSATMYFQMPYHMLGKDSESQALRKAFPLQLTAVDYLAVAGEDDGSDAASSWQVEAAAPEPLAMPPRRQAGPSDYDRIFRNQFGDEPEPGPQPPDPEPDPQPDPDPEPDDEPAPQTDTRDRQTRALDRETEQAMERAGI